MRILVCDAVLIVISLAAVCFAQTTAAARAGDIADGAVVNRNNGLVLNTTPCKAPAESQYLQFHNPYHERNLGQASCPGGSTYTKVSVEQQ